MFKRKLMKTMAVLLTVTMLLGDASIAFAAEANPAGLEVVEVNETVDTETVETETEETADTESADAGEQTAEEPKGEDVTSEESTVETPTTEETSEELVEEEGDLDEEGEEEIIEEENAEETDDLSDVFYRNLSEEEITSKMQSFKQVKSMEDAKEGDDYVDNQIITMCDTEEEAEEIAKAYAEATGYDVEVLRFREGVASLKMSGTPKESMAAKKVSAVKLAVELAADTDNNLPVVSPNYMRHITGVNQDTSKESYGDPFLKMYSDYFQWYHNLINDKFAWDLLQKDATFKTNLSKVKFGIIDTGVNYNHTDLNVAKHECFVTFTSCCSNGDDDNGHGSNCAGLAVSKDNTVGGRGVAPGLAIYSAKALDTNGGGTDEDIIAAVNSFWKSGKVVDVLSMSLGGTWYSQVYQDAINGAYKKGITVVAAAGNENYNIMSYPAAFEHVICVAALNSDYEKSDFSNFGSWVDIAAPGGEGLYSANYSRFLRYEPMWSTGCAGADGVQTVGGQYYYDCVGTSQATPLVAATAALIVAKNPGINPDGVERILKSSAKTLTSKYQLGVGCIDVAAALQINASVAAPKALKGKSAASGELVSGAVNAATKVYFDTTSQSIVYYTLDGTVPNPLKNTSGSVKEYDESHPIVLPGKGPVTVKAMRVMHGVESPEATYVYDIKDSLVEGIGLASSTQSFAVSVGKSFKIIPTVYPEYAKDKSVSYTVADDTIANVSKDGLVTGRSAGTTKVTVKALDGSGIKNSVTVRVMDSIKSIAVDAKSDTIELNTDAIFQMGFYNVDTGKIAYNGSNNTDKNGNTFDVNVFPLESSANITVTSSKEKIVRASKNANGGITVQAVSSGTAKLTIAAADGTGVKTVVNVHVTTPISVISLSAPNGLNKVAAGKTIKPVITFNNGLSKPDKTEVVWELTEGGSYASVDAKTGVVKAASNITSQAKVKVRATAKDDSKVYGELTIQVYPITKSMNSFATDAIFNVGNCVDLSYYPFWDTTPSNAMNVYSYKSSSQAVVAVDQNGFMRALKPGTATITATAMDGSGKKASIKIKVLDGEKYGGFDGSGVQQNVLYPGKSITFKLNQKGLPSLYVKTARLLVDYNEYTGDLYDENEYIKTKKLTAVGKDNLKNLSGPVSVELPMIVATYYNPYNRTYYYDTLDVIRVDLYPAKANAVKLAATERDMKVGEHFMLNPSVEPANACQKFFQYKSSDSKIVKVTDCGELVALKSGKATITVLAGDGSGVKATCKVNVVTPVTSIKLENPTKQPVLGVGKTLKLNAITNADATVKTFEWSSSNEKIATVDQKGVVKAVGQSVGSVTITARTKDGTGLSASMPINVQPATTGIKLNNADDQKLTLYTAASASGLPVEKTVKYTVEPAGAYQPCIATSSNPDVVSVSNGVGTANLKAKAPGTAKVTIKAQDGTGKTTTFSVTVIEPVVDMKIVAKGNAALLPGKTIQLEAVAIPSGKAVKAEWSLDGSSSSYATIDKNSGKLTAKDGSANTTVIVKAKALDGSGVAVSYSFQIFKDEVEKVIVTGEKSYEVLTKVTLGTNGVQIGVLPGYVELTGYAYNKDKVSLPNKISYVSSNPSVAAITTTTTGKIAIVGGEPGKATVTAKAADGTGKAQQIAVTVINPVKNIRMSSANGEFTLAEGAKLKLQAVTNLNATNQKVTWSVAKEDEKYLTVAADGTVEAKQSGVTSSKGIAVTAKATDGTGISCVQMITIRPAAKKIVFNAPKSEIAVGSSIVIPIKADNSNAYQKYYVTYKTGAGVVSYVSATASGTSVKVTGTKAGTVTITATALDGSGLSEKYVVTVK